MSEATLPELPLCGTELACKIIFSQDGVRDSRREKYEINNFQRLPKHLRQDLNTTAVHTDEE
jgi:hypothetical protein